MNQSTLRFAWLMICAIPLTAASQKKNFTYEQLFNNKYPAVMRSLPVIEGWADEEHYLERKINAGGAEKEELFSIEVKSGKSVPYTGSGRMPEEKNFSFRGLEKNAQNITPSPNGKWVAYTKKNNLYALDISTGKETQFTTDGSETILNGYASWVYYEEILGRASHYRAFWWSPDSKHIAYMHFDDSQVPVFPIYVAEGQHGYLINQHYPKAGDKNPEVRIGIVSLDNAATAWADFDPKADQYFGAPLWTPGNQLWAPWMNRGQDTLIIYQLDKNNGAKKPVYSENQPTWIGLDAENRITFLQNGKHFIAESDKDGWENLYLYDMEGKFINQITNGTFWGTDILAIDEKAKQIYIKARKDNPSRFDIYRISFNGKEQTKISSGDFSNDEVEASPHGKYFITTYSNLSSPPVMALMNNKGKILRQLGDSKGPEFDDYAIPATSLFTVRSSDNVFDLPMTITYPLHFDSSKKYPILVNIYGGPNAGTVYDRWKPATGISQWIAQEGVVLVTMDNRSSGHFGKKGMNYIFKQLGKWEIEDYMTCGRWLRLQTWADTSKVAIAGGSFGGYISCMALTYGADVFNYGIASYAVTNWELYDTHYTERFMKTPAQNPEGYKITSPVNYIDRYRGLLRIIHGSTDDNVHMQNSLQLIDALENKNKHFEMMIYPGQRHGFRGEKTDHSRAETAGFIYRYLLNKELPQGFGQ